MEDKKILKNTQKENPEKKTDPSLEKLEKTKIKSRLEIVLKDLLEDFPFLQKAIDKYGLQKIEDFYVAVVYGIYPIGITPYGVQRISNMIISPIKKQLDLPLDLQKKLEAKKLINHPKFVRQEANRYKKLGFKWRKPKGIHSKRRRKLKRRSPLPTSGYSTDTDVKFMHPSGFFLKHVFNVKDVLEIKNYKTRVAALIGGTVGSRKRIEIERCAVRESIYVVNRSNKGFIQAVKKTKILDKKREKEMMRKEEENEPKN